MSEISTAMVSEEKMGNQPHEHNYRHLHTVCTVEAGRSHTFYKRMDEFYCTVCLDINIKTQTGEGIDGVRPEWWFITGD